MSDGTTEWVTVRVPAEDRERAKAERPDGATHGDCLVAGAEALADRDAPTDADALADAVAERVSMANEPGVEIDTESILSDLARLQELVDQVPERTADELQERRR